MVVFPYFCFVSLCDRSDAWYEPKLACCLQSGGAARGGSLLQCVYVCVSACLCTPTRLYCCLTIQFLLAFENKALYWKFFLIILICLELIFKGQMQEEYNGNVAATGFRWFSAHVVVNLHSYLIAGTLRESEWWRFTGVFI